MGKADITLVADSGSTKTDWIFFSQENGISEVRTSGINPVRDSEDAIFHVIVEQLLPRLPEGTPVRDIYFYGAGCLQPYSQAAHRVLERIFPRANVQVESDLLGAARALCGRSAGIACILGTGANSCLYDGECIAAHVPPLGFILGDEGSGAVLGRMLVGNLLKGIFPEVMKEEFLKEHVLSEAEIIDRVYRRPQPNRFLASLVPFIARNRAHVQVHAMLQDAFRSFFARNVRAYAHPEMSVNFVGGIAHVFRDELTEAAAAEGMIVGRILQSPIQEIAVYHGWRTDNECCARKNINIC